MNIRFTTDAHQNVTVHVSGVLGISESSNFTIKMQKTDLDNAHSVTLDFSDLNYITSSGLRSILTLKKRLGEKSFRITGINETVFQVLHMTGFDAIIDCETITETVDYTKMSFRDFLAYKTQSGYQGIVLQDSTHKLTWADVDRGARNIAADLAKMGVGKGTHVAICSANSVNWLLTFFAVQLLGGIAILINYKSEVEAIRDIADYADVTCFCYGKVLSVKDPEDLLRVITAPGSKIRHVYDMSPEQDFLSSEPDAALKIENTVNADDVALMIFTSGSTGLPKAVMLTAYNLLTSAGNIAESIEMSSRDIACVVAPMFHISGIGGGTFTNLIADARIVLPPSTKPDVILGIIEKEKCTIFNCVPTVMLTLINHPDFTAEKLSSLRYSKLSGAPVTKAQFMEITEKTGNIHLASSYGMTEIAPITGTVYGDSIEHITETVGKPVEDVEVRVVDPVTRAALPTGVSGEIIARGVNLLTGYYKLPIDKQPIDADGWMCTGDLGYFAEDGYLHFTGRLKNLIIRGGENISPGEIVSAITELPYIADARAFGIPDERMGELVGAAVTLREGAVFNEEAIRSHMEKKLAKYKWPSAYACFDAFPYLPNGKVDEVSLKKAFLARIKKG